MIKRSFKLALLPAAVFCMVFGSGLRAQTLDEARTFTKNEQYDKAEALFQQLIQKEPANSAIYFHYGENTLLNYFADTISNSLNIATKEAADEVVSDMNVTSYGTDVLSTGVNAVSNAAKSVFRKKRRKGSFRNSSM